MKAKQNKQTKSTSVEQQIKGEQIPEFYTNGIQVHISPFELELQTQLIDSTGSKAKQAQYRAAAARQRQRESRSGNIFGGVSASGSASNPYHFKGSRPILECGKLP